MHTSPHRRSSESSGITERIITLFEDQLDLFALEMEYETRLNLRRLWIAIVSIVLFLSAFVLLQIAIIGALMATGIGLGLSCVGLALVYAGVGFLLVSKAGRRDPNAGRPFQASREQLHENLKWIQKRFS